MQSGVWFWEKLREDDIDLSLEEKLDKARWNMSFRLDSELRQFNIEDCVKNGIVARYPLPIVDKHILDTLSD
jgi:hypothetical protein